jgi:hypothetical protein
MAIGAAGMSRFPAGALALFGCLGALLWFAVLNGAPGPIEPVRAGADARFGQLPLRFEVNRGQAAANVDFLARGPGYTMSLGRDGAVLALTAGKGTGHVAATGASVAVGMHVVGGNPHPEVSGVDKLASVSNYMVGNDASKWHTNVPSYARVHYEDVYPGIDLVYRGNQRELEYDLIVAPGSDPATIALGFRGSESLSITPKGDLLIHSRAGAIRQRRPILFQGDGAARTPVSGSYVLRDSGRQVGFRVGAYDRARPLVIDPTIAYSTFLGGHNLNVGNGMAQDTTNGIAVGADGSTYIVGFTDAIAPTPYPTTAGAVQTAFGGGARDGFVTKLNPAGTAIVYSTYLGGSAEDRATDVEVDAAGNAYVSGFTISTQFPTTAGAAQTTFGGGTGVGNPPVQPRDAFIAKLNPSGSTLLYSTYLGGTGIDTANRIDLGPDNSAYVSGNTGPGTGTAAAPSHTNNFPTTAGAFQATFGGGTGNTAPNDAFVAKLNPAGSQFTYSTYLGGALSDSGASIGVDSSGAAYVAGTTTSPTIFGTAGAFDTTLAPPALPDTTQRSDAYVAKLNPAGSALDYATYIGGARSESGTGIAVDSAGSAHVTGETASTDFPTKNANQPANASAAGPNDADSFVTKLNPAGSDTVYSTYNGSITYDTGTDIAVDGDGNAYAVGNTLGGFPLKNPVQVRTGDYDSYLTKFNPAGTSIYSTIYGGGSRDFGQAVAADNSGNAYIGGRTDYYSDDSFPLKNAAQPLNGGFADAWIAKISPTPTTPLVNSLRSRGGPVTGATTVVLNGTGFTGTSAVRFGTTPAASFGVDSDNQITAVSPAHAAGKVNVTIVTPAGTSPANPVTLFEYAEGLWKPTGSLGVVHYDQQMRLLDNGRVLIVGGTNSMFGNTITDSELYNPLTRQWSATGSLNTPRSSYTLTRLDGPACRTATPAAYCGDILVAGGSPNSASANATLNTAETYDATTGTWTPTTGTMVTARSQHAATLIDGPACHAASPPAYCGKVLLSGGVASAVPLSSAELYDPATGTFTATGSHLHTARQTISVLLRDGKVMLSGGEGTFRDYAEIYDPATGDWSLTGKLNVGRERQSVVVLHDGRVLTAAGTRPGDPPHLNLAPLAGNSSELYDPVAGTWTLIADLLTGVARNNHDTALLPNGKVLVAGGGRGGLTAEVFDPADSTWESGGLLTFSRGSGHPQSSSYETVVLSSDAATFEADAAVCGNDCGKVLVAGNNDDRTAELYTPEPQISGLAPNDGPSAGGISVQISGHGFTHGTRSVHFGDKPAASYTVDSYGRITAVAPSGSGAVKVSVVNEGGRAISAGDFTYVAPATPPPPPPPVAQTPPPPPPPAPAPVARAGRLSASLTPTRDLRAAFRFRISGRLTLPTGVAKSVGCKGTVRLRIKRGSTIIRSKRTTLRSDCTYSSTTSFPSRRLFARASRLAFETRFLGNARVRPANGPTRTGRVRR